jgi:4-hydroxybenzoate polyprenyltransferase
MNQSSLSIIKNTLARLPNLWATLVASFDHSAARRFQLNRPSAVSLMLWPALWGFWATSNPNWGQLPALILLIIALRLLALLLTTPPQLDEEAEPIEPHPAWLIALGAIALWLAVSLGPVTLALTLLWSGGLAATPFFNRHSWMPQIVNSLLCGVWPVLFGAAAAESFSLALIFLVPAALLWGLAVESIRAYGRRSLDLTYGIKSLPLWLGENQVPVLGVVLIFTLSFLLASATVSAWNGLFYACLMGAQALWTMGWHACCDESAASIRAGYRYMVLGALAVSLGLLLS